MNLDALKFVCVDLNLLPADAINKSTCSSNLILWVSVCPQLLVAMMLSKIFHQRLTMPLDALPTTKIDSVSLLKRTQDVVENLTIPSWLPRPPLDVGLRDAGTLKADTWRILFEIFLPLALLSLWKETSPLAAPNADQMGSVLETSMYLTCASLIVMKDRLSFDDQANFKKYLRQHLLGVKQHFPYGFIPSYHAAFHIADGMDLFSTVRNASCFRGERLIGKLRSIPHNHIIGKRPSAQHLRP